MDAVVKRGCLELLQDPSDAATITALLDAVARCDPSMAEHLRKFRATRQSYPYGFVWSAEAVERCGVQYVVVRAIPQSLGVQFACGCAKQVLPYLEEGHPSERAPRALIELVKKSHSESVTKRSIRAKLDDVMKLGRRIDDEWHRAYRTGEFDQLTQRELNLSQRPLLSVDVVGSAAGAVGLSKSKTGWLTSIDATVNGHLEVEAIGHGEEGVLRAREWQLSFLTQLIRSAD